MPIGGKEELAERAGGGAGTERHRAPFLGQQLPEGAEHKVERTTRQAETDQDAAADLQHAGRGRIGHDHQARRIEQPADAEDPHGAESVRHGAREGLADPPQEVLHRDGKPEHIPAPAEFHRHGDLEQPGGGTRPEGDQGDKTP